ncbi:MAG: hypothetical protein CML66_20740 [Rhodobacteraceae bacterium]|nr:hypothetical protein [Paracoccaceae bacterium]MAY47222.1 hypothetical protein [Paracoccaceae bacterium]
MFRSGFQTLQRLFPILVGAALFGAGLYALYHLLRPVDFDEVAAHFRSIPAGVLVQAVLATIVGYASLVFYDWYALRYIGKTLTPGVIALGGFLGYAFGNTIGVSIVSGGAVRYRIYSAVGLNAFEVAAVSGYIAIALGVGLSMIGVAALMIRPEALADYLPFSAATVQLWCGAGLAIAVLLIAGLSISQRKIRIRGYDLRMPPIGDLAGQVVVTVVDVAAAAYVLWVLLPAGKPDFAMFVAEFAAATMVGVISHVPGGVGVFESIMITTLSPEVPVSDAAAALLLFRLIYYILPFMLGFLVVALNEVRTVSGIGGRLWGRLSGPLQSAVTTLHGLAPGLVAVVAFGFGTYLLLVTMIPAVRSEAMEESDLIGSLLLEGGTLASAVAGGVLLILSQGLARRRSSAFWLSILALAGASVAALLNGFDLENALILAAAALGLVPFRTAFDRPGRLTQGLFEARWFAMVGAVALATAAFFFFVHKAVPYSNNLWTDFSATSATPRVLRAALAATALLFFFALHVAMRPSRRHAPAAADAGDFARAAAIVRASATPQGWLSQTGDKRLLFSDMGGAFLMYGVQGRSWIALGDPVGDASEFQGLCWTFSELAIRANCRPVFYEVSADNLSLWPELGFTLNKVGEEAVVRLPDFSLSGSKFKTMRSALNKRAREGYELEILSPPHAPDLLDRLAEISDAWLGGKTGREKGFSVGKFDRAYLDHFDLGVVRKDGRIIAFSNIMATSCGRYAAIDLMRYVPEEASGIMEFMFLRLIDHYKTAGAEEFSLGTAPLSGLSERSMARSWNRYGSLIYRHGGAFYNFEGLRAFKQKFQPEWRPRYLALPPNVSPLRAMGDAALLIAGTPRGLVGK